MNKTNIVSLGCSTSAVFMHNRPLSALGRRSLCTTPIACSVPGGFHELKCTPCSYSGAFVFPNFSKGCHAVKGESIFHRCGGAMSKLTLLKGNRLQHSSRAKTNFQKSNMRDGLRERSGDNLNWVPSFAKRSMEASDHAPFERRDRKTWQIQKKALSEKFGSSGWSPRKRISPDSLEGIRSLNAQYPDRYTTAVLAEHFRVSPEAIRRILKSKWRPNDDEEDNRRERWNKRGVNIWGQMSELGIKPPSIWRHQGVGRLERDYRAVDGQLRPVNKQTRKARSNSSRSPKRLPALPASSLEVGQVSLADRIL